MKKIISILLSLTLVAIAFSGCSASSNSSPAPASTAPQSSSQEPASTGTVRVLQLGHLDPGKENNAYQVFCTLFKQNLQEISGGKFDVDIFSDAQLGGDRAMMEGMKIGTVDMAMITNMNYSTFVPGFMLYDLPYLFPDYETAYAALDDKTITEPMEKQLYDEFGVKFLDWGDSGFRYVINNVRPISTLDDFKGIKLRMPENPLYVETFKALGANPTTMAFSETFTAVQQKTVDGLEITASAINTSGFYEVCKYLSLTRHFYSPIAINISRLIWDDLTEEEQGWFQEAATKTKQEQRIRVQAIEQDLLDEMGKVIAINEVADIESFRNATKSSYDYIREKVGNEPVDQMLKKVGV